ncbi:MAG: phage tail tape measure protein [Aeromonas veronii]
MAIENRRLSFILDMVDKVTGPAQKVGQTTQALGQQVQTAQKKLAQLDSVAGDVKGLQKMRQGLQQATQQTRAHAAAVDASRSALVASKAEQARINAELKKAEQALKKASAAQGQNGHIVALHQQRVERLMAAQQRGNEAITRHKATLDAATKSAASHERETAKQTSEMRKLEERLRAAGINTGRLDQTLQRATASQARANQELQRHQRDLTAATRKQEQMTAAKERYNKALEQSNRAMAAGGKTMAAGAALTATSAMIAKPYKDFAAQMSAVQATGGLDDAAKDRLAKQARLEAKTSSFGALEAAQAQEYLAMAGFDERKITASLRGVMDLAVATKTGLAETADIGSNILSGFGLDADQMGRVGDVLTATTTSANTNLAELGETMKYVAGVSKTAGYSLESTAAAAGLMANAGIKGSQAGTALRAAILRMGALPKAAKKAFADLGVETMDAQGNLRGLEFVLADVAKAMEGMGTGEKIQKLSAMFGAEAAAGIAELLSKSSGDDMFNYIKKLEGSQGATAKAAAARAANLDGDLKQLYSGIEEVQHKYGESLDLMYRGVVRAATGVIAKLDEWMARHPGLVKAIGLAATALGVLLTASGALVVGLGALWLIMAKLRLAAFLMQWAFKGWIKSLASALLSVVALTAKIAIKTAAIALQVAWWGASRAAMLAWVVVCNAVKFAMAALNVVMRLNPIGLLITAVMGLVAAGVWLWKNWGNLPAAFSQLWADICAAFGAAWDYITELLGFDPVAAVREAWDGLGDYFSNLFGGIWDSFMGTVGKIGEKLGSVGGWFKEQGDWALGGFGFFDEDPEKAAAVNEAPKKSPETGAVEAPKAARQGGQIKPETRTVHYAPTVAPVFHITAAPGMNEEQIASIAVKKIEAAQRDMERANRGRLGDF